MRCSRGTSSPRKHSPIPDRKSGGRWLSSIWLLSGALRTAKRQTDYSSRRRATIERTPSGGFVLAADPTRGLPLPVEKNPKRPVLDDDRVDQLVAVAGQVQMRVGFGRKALWEPSYLPALIRVAADAGRRIRSIVHLRWSD